jgi:hypothetical protein
MKNNVTKTASINGINFEYLCRSCGDLIVIKGKSGFVYSTDEHQSAGRNQPVGVYHSVPRKSVKGVDANYPYQTQVDTLIPGVSVDEFRAALNLR